MDRKIEIIPYKESLLDTWEKIVEDSNNGTIYHTQRFLGYHPASRFRNFHRLIALDGKPCCVIPGCITASGKGKTFVSYAGASFGGFVVPGEFGLEETGAVISAFSKHLAAEGFRRIEITLPPLFCLRRQNHYADFVLSREGFGFRKRELSAVIPLHYPDGDILKTFDPSTRRSVRKAESLGVTVVNDDSDAAYGAYYRILSENLEMRHNVKPVHSLEEMKDIKRRFPDRVFLFCAFHKGEMAGGIWLFKASRDVSVAFYISHRHECQEIRPVNMLYYETIKKAVEWGQKYYDLGLFTVDMDPNYGLGRFKEGFGAQGVFRDYFRKDI